MDGFNREIETLVSQMDALSQTPNERINCDKLDELKRVRDRLLTVMGQKSGYMLAKADLELDRPASAATGGNGKVTSKPAADTDPGNPTPGESGKSARLDRPSLEPSGENRAGAPSSSEAGAQKETASDGQNGLDKPSATLNPQLPERRPPLSQTAQSWSAENQAVAPQPGYVEGDRLASATETEPPTQLAPPPAGETLPPPASELDTTYSIDEIQEAGRGIFGTITAQFAAAANYAFQRFGRPNAYITGSEGGAAFLAGLRFGKGTLYSKTLPPSEIYWQGPSLGYDLGAEGSSALFLVYNLEDPDRIYGRFTGVGGSAYVAGGVGVNVLGKGDMVMVPIRTGVGLRLGANVAYLKFTDRQTWNPF
ncbi:MAG: DUF1134 domain-containing protein [Rhodomicrobium sp.]|nr:DUF1134 domain-containing protein [Rhodomicrobium sp.]